MVWCMHVYAHMGVCMCVHVYAGVHRYEYLGLQRAVIDV